MNVENVEVYGLAQSIRASKYPMAVDISKLNEDVTDNVRKLAMSPKGEGHDNFLQGIVVQFDLTFSLKAWVEMQRYHFVDFVSSQSTMHRIERMDIDEQCNEYVSKDMLRIFKQIRQNYFDDPTPQNRLKLLYNIPSGMTYTARMTTNYRQLKTIYAQRKNHRLPEWRAFCEWIETLPLSYLITGKWCEDGEN